MAIAPRGTRTHGLSAWQALCSRHLVEKISKIAGGSTILYGGHKFGTKVRDMKSDHISTRRLYEAVVEKATLEQPEIEHLQTCDECLELVRLFVRQHIQKSKGTNQ
jgi:hypothetical protein